jgi:hypothetical protein
MLKEWDLKEQCVETEAWNQKKKAKQVKRHVKIQDESRQEKTTNKAKNNE